LAGKQGVDAQNKSFYFVFFPLFVVGGHCKPLSGRIFRRMKAAKKIRAGKPTVGFLIFGRCGNIVA
jgi:hypothetical protein